MKVGIEKFDALLNTNIIFRQDNQSFSKVGVLRAYIINYLHLLKENCKVYKRKNFRRSCRFKINSLTYKSWVSFNLDSIENKQLWIPPGFAHGFLTLSNEAIVQYKTTDFWDKNAERSIIWNDEKIKITGY